MKINFQRRLNVGKLVVLIVCCLSLVPITILVVSAILASAFEDKPFDDTVLGGLCDLYN